jgi:inner membrane protein
MLFKTHLALIIFFILLLYNSVDSKIIFVIIALIATVIPDLDTSNSKFGKHPIFRPIQFFVKHRGFFHTITFAFLISVVIAIFFPVASFGFFIGYSLHIVGDSFTKEGVQPFWPLKSRSYGIVNTGGKLESILLLSLAIVDVFLFWYIFIF